MDDSNHPSTEPALPPEVDAERSAVADPSQPMAAKDRMVLTGLAAELATLTHRAENASAEVAAIEVRMQGLVDDLTAVAGVDLHDPASPTPADAGATLPP